MKTSTDDSCSDECDCGPSSGSETVASTTVGTFAVSTAYALDTAATLATYSRSTWVRHRQGSRTLGKVGQVACMCWYERKKKHSKRPTTYRRCRHLLWLPPDASKKLVEHDVKSGALISQPNVPTPASLLFSCVKVLAMWKG